MEWTKRQQKYAENWKAETVYTPAFVLDGSEWRNTTVPVNDEASGVLKVVVRDDATVIVTFEPATRNSGEFEVYAARLGFGINVNVRAGENKGRSLRHDFIVLSLAHGKLDLGTQDPLHLVPPYESPKRPERIALAAWITNVGAIKPIQAIGGWLP